MSVEQRLIDALRTSERVEPSTDLWSRVVHSIEEDRAHRRRVRVSSTLTALVAAVLVAVGWIATTDGPSGRLVEPAVLEALETVALGVLVAVLGPAIRRFGRNYALDLWPRLPSTATVMIRLLDLAYLLVFVGFVLVTVDFDVTTPGHLGECLPADCPTVGSQLQSSGERIGGLLLVMGLLHGVTIVVLPVVALISNSTRAGRRLPRWLGVAITVGAVAAGALLFMVLLGALIGMAGS